MRLSNKMTAFTATGLLSLFCHVAQADGLADLKGALARLQGHAPLKAMLEAKTWSRQGEGKELEENQGQASIVVEDGPGGLQVLYGKDMLARLETEEFAKEKDHKAKTPTLSALKEFNTGELRPMISAAGSLSRAMEKAVYKSEKTESYKGKPARLLNFDLPIDRLTEKERKYLKKFESSLDIWIAADGTPLASRTRQNLTGRAFVVINFESKNEDESTYSLVGDRLLTVRKESKKSGSGAGEKGESKTTKTLQLQS